MASVRPAFSIACGLYVLVGLTFAAPPDEDDEEFRPGLVAEYRTGKQAVTRIDSDVAFAWDEAAPDARVSAERFEATWRGFLLIRLEAKHRLHAFVQGDVTVELDGRRVLHGTAKQPQWISGDEFSPGFAERPLVVTFRKTEQTAQLKLFWSSDTFGLEPLPAELLFHEQTPAEVALIERGRQQFAAFRCRRCHVRDGDSLAPVAPSLQHVAAGMTAEQIATRLLPPKTAHQVSRGASAPGPDGENIRGLTHPGSPESDDRRMPHFRLNDEQARHLAAFLVKQSESVKLDEAKTIKPKTPKEGEPVVTSQRRGELLLRSVGCLACHRVGELGNSNELSFAGPDLTHVGSRRSASWLTTWLANSQRLNADHRMPVFALTDEERHLIVMALTELKPTGAPSGVSPRTSNDKNVRGLTPTGSPRASVESSPDDIAHGRQLFEQLRCAACHRVTDKKFTEFTRAKSDLSQPISDWSKSCWAEGQGTRGGGREKQLAGLSSQPTYLGLDAEAIKAFLASRWNVKLSPDSQFVRGTQLLEEKNCFACHPRHGGLGLGRTAKLVASADKDLNGQAPAMVAPSLNAIGDKLLDEALSIAVRGERQPIRMPWLKVRMPKFKHSPDELATLTRYFVEHDRIPFETKRPGDKETGGPGEKSPAVLPLSPGLLVSSSPSAETHLAGQALTGVRGWSCIACHKIGDYEPKQVALGARGSDLKMLGKHIRPEFFFRWIASPLRVIPGVEMPQFNRPVAGVLDGNLSKQHAALWQALNDPNFQPPTNPANVEQLWVVNPGERPRIIRDVFSLPKELGGGPVPRSFAVGFDNGHSFLFDLDTASLRQWTFGDFARQQAIGKRWQWEMAGLPLGGFGSDSTVALKRTTELKAPIRTPTAIINLSYDTIPRILPDIKEPLLRLTYTLLFGGDQLEDLLALKPEQILFGKVEHALTVQETLTPLMNSPNEGSSTGIERKLEIRHSVGSGGVAPLDLLIRRPQPLNAAVAAKSEVAQLEKLVADDEWRKLPLDQSNDKDWLSIRIEPFETVRVTLRYSASLPPPQLTAVTKPISRSPKLAISSVPGFDGWQLPLDSSVMPTAMSWSRDGKLAFTSLKGHAFVARDTDGDTLEDELKLVEEGLAAPYGIIGFPVDQLSSTPDDENFLIAHKPELLGVVNIDSDRPTGSRHRSGSAAGWGYNDDYHDWTSGIVRDSQGRFLIGLGSDYTDKNRLASKSLWRGKILRIDSRALNKFIDGGGKEKGASEKFITPIGHAFRYPTGIAINDRDEVFVSDQQGVQNCFNEINYLVEGAHYGVPSTHEEDKDAPETKAAIQIPHPWTRSVNGLCFLTGNEGYPDLKGHGIGCEYNGRFLIRFSTQRVGDVMQGAVYPFSKPDDVGWVSDPTLPGAKKVGSESKSKAVGTESQPTANFEGPLCCGVSPKGEIYIGSIADSGWAGGQNTGSIVQLKGNGQRPNGIREIRATRDGFDIEFFAPVDRARATNPEHYSISGYTRVWGGAYATPDSDRHRCKVESVHLSADGKTAQLKVDPRKTPNYVYDISCRDVSSTNQPLFPSYGFYTLHKIPND